jgi:hypothetical protein
MSAEMISVQSRTIPVPVHPGNALAVAGLVCGIVGILLFNVILGPLAVIFGGVGWSRANTGARHKGLAVSGVVLGILDLLVFGVVLVWASHHGGSFNLHIGG